MPDPTAAGPHDRTQRPEEPGPLRTLLFAFAVCAVCSTVVTGAVVLLRPLQVENREEDREARVRALVSGLPGVSEMIEGEGERRLRVELHAVELSTGLYAPSVEPESLLPGGGGASQGAALPPERDPAGIGSLPRHAPVYELRREGRVHTVILPVRGSGYQSTLKGYLAVAGDGDTVRAITFTEHGETPGLGAEIESPQWQDLWRGLRLRNDRGEVRIQVVQNAPAEGSVHQVRGISGATRTGEGVTALVRFWVGPAGFGPYLERIAAQGVEP